MLRRSGDRFPREAVRDLLGVVRAIYAAAQVAGAGREDLARIARAGAELRRALDMAAKTPPGSPEREAAFRLADSATLRVGRLVDALTPAEPLVAAARARVSGARISVRRKRPER